MERNSKYLRIKPDSNAGEVVSPTNGLPHDPDFWGVPRFLFRDLFFDMQRPPSGHPKQNRKGCCLRSWFIWFVVGVNSSTGSTKWLRWLFCSVRFGLLGFFRANQERPQSIFEAALKSLDLIQFHQNMDPPVRAWKLSVLSSSGRWRCGLRRLGSSHALSLGLRFGLAFGVQSTGHSLPSHLWTTLHERKWHDFKFVHLEYPTFSCVTFFFYKYRRMTQIIKFLSKVCVQISTTRHGIFN